MIAPLAQRLAALSQDQLHAVLGGMSPAELEALKWSWELWRMPHQVPPPEPWSTWVMLAGRGAGKTYAGAQWVRSQVESGRCRSIGLIAQTHMAGRKIMVEAESGILAVSPPSFQPTYEMASARITWPNGAQAHLVTAEAPERIRGHNFDAIWADELCSWESAEETWNQAQLALRLTGPLGDPPRTVVTSTPKNHALLKRILADPGTVVTKASSYANVYLNPERLSQWKSQYEGSGLARQEIHAELIEDAEGALWNRALIEQTRVRSAPETLKRVVVAIDPAGSSGKNSDETGIIVAARDGDGHGFVISDLSGKYTPEGWARKAIDAFRRHKADRIIAETNFGAAMVENTLRALDPSVSFEPLHASRGKAMRAEPIVALFE